MTVHQLDLGTSDVHTDGPMSVGKPRGKTMAKPAKKLPVEPAATKKRKRRLHVRADLADGGSLHVSHHAMADRDVRLDGVEVSMLLADGESKPVWIQLAKPGTFRGHPAGPFTMDAKTFGDIVRNFNATQNKRVPVDFEHASEADPTEGNIPVDGAPAQGWIVDMKVDGGNLWGLVEWGDKARDYIRSGQYRYFSPAIRFGAKDRVTGESIGARMTSGALTNNPFLDGLKPLAAKDLVHGPDGIVGHVTTMRLAHAPHEYMPGIKAALRMPDLSSAKQCSDMLGQLRDHLDAADGDHTAAHEGIALNDYCMSLRSLVGAQPGATWDEVFDIVQDLIDAAMDRHELEMHPGQAPSSEAEMTDTEEDPEDVAGAMSDPSTETTTMTDAIKMKELETSNATLSLQLKDATGKVEKLEGEIKTLRDAQAARDAKDLADEVEAAFSTYKDAKKLSDTDKANMLVMCKAAPDAFRAMFPKVKPEEQHLLREVVSRRGPQHVPIPTTPEGEEVTIVTLADKLQEKNPKLSREDALIDAEKQIRKGQNAA